MTEIYIYIIYDKITFGGVKWANVFTFAQNHFNYTSNQLQLMRKLFIISTAVLFALGARHAIAAPNGDNNVSKATATVEATVTIPEEMTVAMADVSDTIRVTVNTTASYDASKTLWSTTDATGATDASIISGIYDVSDTEGVKAIMTFAGKTGTAYATGTVYLYDSSGAIIGTYTTNQCKITVTPPVKPVTSMRFSKEVIEEGLSQRRAGDMEYPDLIFTPTDATYTSTTIEESADNENLIKASARWDYLAAEGEIRYVASYKYDSSVTASYKRVVKCKKPVTEIKLNGDSVIEVEPYTFVGEFDISVTPEDADCLSFGNGYKVRYVADDPNIAGWWRTRQFIKAITPGETVVNIEAADQKGSKAPFTLKVKEPDYTEYDGYQDGVFILAAGFGNYDFGGVINHLTAENNLMYRVYERENPGFTLGDVTGMAYYGGNIYISTAGSVTTPTISNENTTKYTGTMPNASDAITMLDSKTLKKLDGVTNSATIEGLLSPNKLNVGKYFFCISEWKSGRKKYYGLLIYDNESGMKVKEVAASSKWNYENCLVQLANGKIWFNVDGAKLIDPATLETEDCAFTPVCADPNNNIAWSQEDGMKIYRHDIDTGESKQIFSTENLPCAYDDNRYEPHQKITSMDFNPHTGDLIVTTSEITYSGYPGINEPNNTKYQSSANDYNYVNIIDATTGDLKKSVPMRRYYWNNLKAIIPDKFAPEFINVESSVTLDKEDPALTIDLTDKVTDKDNIDYNISTTLSDAGDATIALATLNDKVLTISPVSVGDTKITLTAESNGVIGIGV